MPHLLDSIQEDLEEYIEGKKSNEGNESVFVISNYENLFKKNSREITEDDCGEHTYEKEPQYPVKGGPGMFFTHRYGQHCV